jgi:hypothetical protein
MRLWAQWQPFHQFFMQIKIIRTSSQSIRFGATESNKYPNYGVNCQQIKDSHSFKKRAKIVRPIEYKRHSQKLREVVKKFDQWL